MWCSLFECFCSTELFSWLQTMGWFLESPNPGYFYNKHSHRLVLISLHTCRKSPSLNWSYNNTTKWKANKVAPITLLCMWGVGGKNIGKALYLWTYTLPPSGPIPYHFVPTGPIPYTSGPIPPLDTPCTYTLPPCGQTDACENNTFSHFVCGWW